MPELKRVSGQQAIRALEKLGFVQVRQRGSHVVLMPRDRWGVLCLCIANWRLPPAWHTPSGWHYA